MKILSMVICLMFLSTFAFADITSNQGEQKAIQSVKNIYKQLESAKENATRDYNALKTYIVDHSAQFTAGDRTKLNDLQAKLTTINTAILDFMAQVQADFAGIAE